MCGFDRLFATDHHPLPFAFDTAVAAVFDNMAERSIPQYREVIRIIAEWCERYCGDKDTIYDVGCSTGNCIAAIIERLDCTPQIVGVDSSRAMLDQAKKKCPSPNVYWLKAPIQEVKLRTARVVVCNYTMMFIPPSDRKQILQSFFLALKKRNGILFLSEKLSCKLEFERMMTRSYEEFKSSQGYSFTEIRRKKMALNEVLVPLPLDFYCETLGDVGFQSVDVLLKWNQFATIVARA